VVAVQAELHARFIRRFQRELYEYDVQDISPKKLKLITDMHLYAQDRFRAIEASQFELETANELPDMDEVIVGIERALSYFDIDFNLLDFLPVKVQQATDGRALMVEFGMRDGWTDKYPSFFRKIVMETPPEKLELIQAVTVEYNYSYNPKAINIVLRQVDKEARKLEAAIQRLSILVWDRATGQFIDHDQVSEN
jgi:hypothetical protein